MAINIIILKYTANGSSATMLVNNVVTFCGLRNNIATNDNIKPPNIQLPVKYDFFFE